MCKQYSLLAALAAVRHAMEGGEQLRDTAQFREIYNVGDKIGEGGFGKGTDFSIDDPNRY